MDTSYRATPQNAPPPPGDDPQLAEQIRAGHETTDVSVRGLFLFAGGLLTFLAVVLVGLVVLFKGYQRVNGWLDARRARTEPGARSLVHVRPEYDGPLLQVTPEEDLRWMRARNAANNGGYGWVDRRTGTVRVPVERAMDLIVQRGLPPVSPGLTIEAIQRQRADPQVYGQALRP